MLGRRLQAEHVRRAALGFHASADDAEQFALSVEHRRAQRAKAVQVARPRLGDRGHDSAQPDRGNVIQIVVGAGDQDRRVERLGRRGRVVERDRRDLFLGLLVQRLERREKSQIELFVLEHYSGGHFRAVGQPILDLLHLTVQFQVPHRAPASSADLRLWIEVRQRRHRQSAGINDRRDALGLAFLARDGNTDAPDLELQHGGEGDYALFVGLQRLPRRGNFVLGQ